MATQMTPNEDPRVYFAAERTLLAWVRTGVALIALGFVVARFGLFVVMTDPPGKEQPNALLPSFVGVALVALGGVLTGLAGLQHALYLRTLPESQRPRSTITAKVALALALTVTALAALLAIHLVS